MEKKEDNSQKRTKREDRKRKIIEAAIRDFGKHGFHGATLSTIAKSVGLSEPGLLHYFPSKVHLLMEVLEVRDKRDIEKFNTVVVNGDNSLFEALEDLVSRNEQKPEIVKLFTVLVGESVEDRHPAHNFFVDRYERIYQQLFTTLLSEGDIANRISEQDLREITSIIISVIDGLQIQWLLNPNKISLSKTYNFFSKIIQNFLDTDK